MFKVGDRVKIVSDGKIHTGYREAARRLNAQKWFFGSNARNGETGIVKSFQQERMADGGVLYLVDVGDREILIGLNGLALLQNRRGRPSTKPRPVKFLLKYDLDVDPIEEFETMDQVNDRIKQLLERSDLKRDSMVVYEIKSKKQVKVETKISIK